MRPQRAAGRRVTDVLAGPKVICSLLAGPKVGSLMAGPKAGRNLAGPKVICNNGRPYSDGESDLGRPALQQPRILSTAKTAGPIDL